MGKKSVRARVEIDCKTFAGKELKNSDFPKIPTSVLRLMVNPVYLPG
jgi:hypothetical protein